MIFLFRHRRREHFLVLMLAGVFLTVSFWQSSHVHHQHGPADAEMTLWHITFMPEFSDSHHDDAEHHGEHSHDAPDKTAHVYKHQPGWKSLRGKADGDSKLKIPVVICSRAITTPPLDTSRIPSSYAIEESEIWTDGCPPARAPPIIFGLS
jgi:hypothetical protein